MGQRWREWADGGDRIYGERDFSASSVFEEIVFHGVEGPGSARVPALNRPISALFKMSSGRLPGSAGSVPAGGPPRLLPSPRRPPSGCGRLGEGIRRGGGAQLVLVRTLESPSKRTVGPAHLKRAQMNVSVLGLCPNQETAT